MVVAFFGREHSASSAVSNLFDCNHQGKSKMSLLVKFVNEKSVDLLEKLAFDGFLGLAVDFFLREEDLQRRAALNFFP